MKCLPTLAAAVAASTLVGATVLAPAADARTTNGPLYSSSAWIAGQLTNGVLHDAQYNFDDYGDTATVALALDAAGGFDSAVQAIRSAIRSHFAAYTTLAAYGYPGDVSAGSTAKAIVAEQLDGGTAPAAWISQLSGRVATTAPIAGRIQDAIDPADKSGTDYANVIGQAFAAEALTEAGSGDAASVTSFLLQQQCSSGGFREQFTSDKTATDQSCDGDSSAVPSVDATSFVILSLLPLDGQPAVQSAITKAAGWLAGQQATDGGFGSPENANSTGLAGWALAAAGTTYASNAQAAASWVAKHQVTPTLACAHPKLLDAVGAIAYDDNAMTKAEQNGIGVADASQWRVAASQAIPALATLPNAAPVAVGTLSGPSGFRQAGTTVKLNVADLDGAAACVAGPGGLVRTVTGGPVSVTLPKKTGVASYRLVQFGPAAAARIQVLAAKRLYPKLSATTVKVGRTETVTVSGLAAKEKVTLKFRGVKVVAGAASATGVYRASFTVRGATGSATVTAVGQFADRTGSATLKVVKAS